MYREPCGVVDQVEWLVAAALGVQALDARLPTVCWRPVKAAF